MPTPVTSDTTIPPASGGGFEAAAASILAAAEGSAKIAKASAEGNVIQAGPQGEKNQTNGLKNG